MEQDLFPKDYLKLLFMNHHNIWQTILSATKSLIKELT